MTDTHTGRRRHLLLLAYYFPPMGLSGVQRISKLAKYLPEFGWDVTVVTPSPAGYFAYDESLLADVRVPGVRIVETRSIDPTRLFRGKQTVGLPAESKRRRASLLTNWLFIPDNKLGWWPFVRSAAFRQHCRRPFDAVLASAPPYTGLLAARSIARALDLPFIADFRDDWLGNPRHHYPTTLHRRLHRALERRVLAAADITVTINPFIADSLGRRSVEAKIAGAVEVVPQGFDPADFPPDDAPGACSDETRMRLLYSGIFYDVQTPDYFLRGLASAIEERPSLRDSISAEFIGLVPPDFRTHVTSCGLDDVVNYHGYLSHDRVTNHLRGSDVLWLTIGRGEGARGISTGKLYEYFGARRPVLGLVPEGVAREDLIRYGAAEISEPDDPTGIAAAILRLHDLWSRGQLPVPDEEFVLQFDRRRLAGRMASMLDRVAAETPE